MADMPADVAGGLANGITGGGTEFTPGWMACEIGGTIPEVGDSVGVIAEGGRGTQRRSLSSAAFAGTTSSTDPTPSTIRENNSNCKRRGGDKFA
jgi:hypothetical protein